MLLGDIHKEIYILQCKYKPLNVLSVGACAYRSYFAELQNESWVKVGRMKVGGEVESK